MVEFFTGVVAIAVEIVGVDDGEADDLLSLLLLFSSWFVMVLEGCVTIVDCVDLIYLGWKHRQGK